MWETEAESGFVFWVEASSGLDCGSESEPGTRLESSTESVASFFMETFKQRTGGVGDALGGLEALRIADQGSVDIGRILLLFDGEMLRTQAGTLVGGFLDARSDSRRPIYPYVFI